MTLLELVEKACISEVKTLIEKLETAVLEKIGDEGEEFVPLAMLSAHHRIVRDTYHKARKSAELLGLDDNYLEAIENALANQINEYITPFAREILENKEIKNKIVLEELIGYSRLPFYIEDRSPMTIEFEEGYDGYEWEIKHRLIEFGVRVEFLKDRYKYEKMVKADLNGDFSSLNHFESELKNLVVKENRFREEHLLKLIDIYNYVPEEEFKNMKKLYAHQFCIHLLNGAHTHLEKAEDVKQESDKNKERFEELDKRKDNLDDEEKGFYDFYKKRKGTNIFGYEFFPDVFSDDFKDPLKTLRSELEGVFRYHKEAEYDIDAKFQEIGDRLLVIGITPEQLYSQE